MHPPSPNQESHHKKRNILFAITGVIIILVTGFFIYNASESYPLGDKLEYVGKVDYGCWVCDSSPASTYYYATDMSVDEVVRYFGRTTLQQQPRTFDEITDFALKSADDHDISIYYYLDKNAIERKYGFRSIDKKYIITIPSFDYDAAKKSV